MSTVDSIHLADPWARPDARAVTAFVDAAAANVADALAGMTTVAAGIRALTPGARLVGPALTVDTRPGDNLAIMRALDRAAPGDVLVVAARGDVGCALIGDLMGERMVARGVAGAIVDGAVRDLDGLCDLGLSVFARAVTPGGPTKAGPGVVGGAVACGGVVVRAGDLIVADADGVVVVPVARLEDVAARVAELAGDEERRRREIRAVGGRS